MIGGSYGGGLQGLVAAVDHRMDAIAIGRSWNTLQYSLDPNNWIPDGADPWDLDAADQGVFKQGWTSLFFALGASQPANGAGGCDPVTQQQEFPGTTPCPGFVPAICPTFEHLSTTGDATDADRELVGSSSVATRLDQLDAPTLLLQGLPDTLFTPTEAAATYRALRERGVPTAMIWDSGGHGGYQTGPGEAEAYGGQWDDSPGQPGGVRERLPAAAHAAVVRAPRPGAARRRHRPGVRLVPRPPRRRRSTPPARPPRPTAPPPTSPPRRPPTTRLVLDPAGGALLPEDAELAGGSAQMVAPPGGEPATYTELPNFSSPGQPGDQPVTDPPGPVAGLHRRAGRHPHRGRRRPHACTCGWPTPPRPTCGCSPGSRTSRRTAPRRPSAVRSPPPGSRPSALDAGAVELRMPAVAWQLDTGSRPPPGAGHRPTRPTPMPACPTS